jgi:hypothetical protein
VSNVFARHAPPGDLVQLGMHEGDETVEGGSLARSPRPEQCGEFRWMVSDASF